MALTTPMFAIGWQRRTSCLEIVPRLRRRRPHQAAVLFGFKKIATIKSQPLLSTHLISKKLLAASRRSQKTTIQSGRKLVLTLLDARSLEKRVWLSTEKISELYMNKRKA